LVGKPVEAVALDEGIGSVVGFAARGESRYRRLLCDVRNDLR
jgi:hypothetical protein